MLTIRVDKLVMVMARYPRAHVDLDHAQRLADAIDAGVRLPPVIVWKGRREVVDGFHRVKAVELRTNGRGTISVIERDYATEADAFLDAVRLNAAQGLALNDADRSRAAELADELDIKPAYLATAMSITVNRLGELATFGRPAVASDLRVRGTQPSVVPGRVPDPITAAPRGTSPAKTVVVAAKGTSPATAQAVVRVPAKVVIAADTLIEFLDSSSAPYSDPRLLGGLVRLKHYLDNMPMPAAELAVAGG